MQAARWPVRVRTTGAERANATSATTGAAARSRGVAARAPLAAAMSNILSVPPAAPATTASSVASNATHSTPLWCPAKLCEPSAPQPRYRHKHARCCAAGAATRSALRHLCAHRAALPARERTAQRVRASDAKAHQQRVRLADGPHVDALVVAAGDHDAAGAAADAHAVDGGGVRHKVLCRDAAEKAARQRRAGAAAPQRPAWEQPGGARTELVCPLHGCCGVERWLKA